LIEKLYNLKKNQTDQKLMQKAQFESKIEKLDIEIALTKNSIDTASVEKYGAISDFMILTMHKNTMKMHIQKLDDEKRNINLQIESLIKEIIELQKEAEQFSYILDEERKEVIRKILVAEEEASTEYMQSKYING
jgi:flagellar hook-basal body complex protein FliE